MDKRIRRNEICVIGLPRCDFVFSSTRTCFIAYGFKESTLEMTILRNLLEKKGIQPVEAGGSLAPAQSAFCAKICSKIITSQFCIVLLNNEEQNGQEIPNANVNMEYGLMIGFNKYIIPFQKLNQSLPFNVAGLDTIKYSEQDFERSASTAIDQAVEVTRQDISPTYDPNQVLEVFLLTKKMLVTPLNSEGDKNLFDLGNPLGFNLLNDFGGFKFTFFGNFTPFRPEVVIWRLRILQDILDGRRAAVPAKVKAGIATGKQATLAKKVLRGMEIWVVVTSKEEKEKIEAELKNKPLSNKTRIFSLTDVVREQQQLTPQ